MKKLYPVVSLLLSAGLVGALYIYVKFASLYIFGHAYYRSPYSFVADVGSAVVAYLIVELTANLMKWSAGVKAIILAAVTIVPYFFIKFFL